MCCVMLADRGDSAAYLDLGLGLDIHAIIVHRGGLAKLGVLATLVESLHEAGPALLPVRFVKKSGSQSP